MSICIVAGARPNFVKVAPIIKELGKRNMNFYLVNTGQHYDENMAKIFYRELEIQPPLYDLGVGSGSHAEQTAKIMIEFEKVLLQKKTDFIVVVGDVNSTLACTITAKKLNIKVVHVEAGLRSFDMEMPEEINRVVTDRLSDLCLVYSDDATENLIKEGVDKNKIKLVGNIMIDSLMSNLEKIENSNILEKHNVNKKTYCLLTLHRPSNVDNENNLKKIIDTVLNTIPQEIKIFFPIHPRTQNKLNEFNLFVKLQNVPNVILTEPLGYINFQHLMKYSLFVLSDSGGIQEETTIYNVPCLTLRSTTERPVCITKGTTKLVNFDNLKENIIEIINGDYKNGEIPMYWDGKTAERIVNEFEHYLKNE